MQTLVTINSRGVVTIPSRMRDALGLKAEDQLIIEKTAEGLLLRPAVGVPVELYTAARITEFTRDETAITQLLAKKKPRK